MRMIALHPGDPEFRSDGCDLTKLRPHQKEFTMNMKVNQDILQGKWKQVKGQAKQQWGKLTDNQLDRIEGRTEELVGLLQEAYGYSRERAHEEVDEFARRMDKM
jgi:uncharacterized protein YjbJ (UPF0337 family)